MQVLDAAATQARVELSSEEVALINNALNEVCNGIDIPEFSTRLGATMEEGRALLRQTDNLCTLMQKP